MKMKIKVSYTSFIDLLMRSLAFSNKKDAVSSLSKWLGVGESSIYNKLNGRSHFTIEEIFVICQNSNISLDSLIHGTSKFNAFIPFFADGLKYKPRSYQDYINNIIGYYIKVKQLTNVHGYFLANELPLFHFLPFPHLMYLKMYIWNETNWKIPGIGNQYQSNEFVRDPITLHGLKILMDQFYSFPNTEIWNPNMLDNTISQFLYLKDLQIIRDHEDLKNIKEQFNRLIDNLEEITNSGQKPENSRGHKKTCDIFITELNTGSEVILVKSYDVNILFQQVDVPNYMSTIDERMITNQFLYFNNIKKISTHITLAGGKDKHLFFARMRGQLNKL